MTLPPKLLYTLPEAAKLVASQFNTDFSYMDLVSYVFEEKLLLSFLLTVLGIEVFRPVAAGRTSVANQGWLHRYQRSAA